MASVDWTGISDDLLGGLLDGQPRGPDFGDRYEVKESIGKGGQGVVFAAYDRTLEREVAIKRLHDPGAPQLPLRNEARTLGRLAHPAVPQIYDQGRSPDGGWFVVMQRINGRRLHEVLDDDGFDLASRLRLFRSVAGAVLHAHSLGILHRDLKPENILVTDAGEPYIIDWGLAANGGPRAVCGSPHFAAPEQLEGQVADRRADVYALGVLLYCILANDLPYGRSVRDFHEFRRLRAGLQKIPLRQRRPELPAALERICDTAMAPQPAARYATVVELITDLDAFQAGRPLARDLPPMPWRRFAWSAGLAAAAMVGVLLGRLSVTPTASSVDVSEPVSGPTDGPLVRVATPVGDDVAALTGGAIDVPDLVPDLTPPEVVTEAESAGIAGADELALPSFEQLAAELFVETAQEDPAGPERTVQASVDEAVEEEVIPLRLPRLEDLLGEDE